MGCGPLICQRVYAVPALQGRLRLQREERVAGERLVDHHPDDAHHRGAAIVPLSLRHGDGPPAIKREEGRGSLQDARRRAAFCLLRNMRDR